MNFQSRSSSALDCWVTEKGGGAGLPLYAAHRSGVTDAYSPYFN